MVKLVIQEKEYIAGKQLRPQFPVAMTGASLEKIIDAALNVVPKDSWTYNSINQAVKIGYESTDVWSSLKPLHSSIACSYYFWT